MTDMEKRLFALIDEYHRNAFQPTDRKLTAFLLANGVVVREEGEWTVCGGDLHSSGYAVFCSACNKVHFVHYKYSLGGLSREELFEKPNFCPNCGADMRKEKPEA